MSDQNYSMENQDGSGNDIKTPDRFSNTPAGKKQKIAAASLVIFAVLILVLWYAQFKQGLSRSFVQPAGQANNNALQVCEGPDCDKNEEARLRAQDTDSDGLSDWDELNVYKTSPYLEDSDSDGFWDKGEIDSGNDPNCPTGRDCSSSTEPAPSAADSDKNASNDASGANSINPIQGQNLSGITGSLAGLDAATLRQKLLDAGMDQKILNQISDEDLMNNFKEVMQGE